MKRLVLALTVVLALASTLAWGQASLKIYWDHSGTNVTRFECVVDGGTPIGLGLPTPTGTTYSTEFSTCTGLSTAGAHTLVIQACNVNGCVAATKLTVVKL